MVNLSLKRKGKREEERVSLEELETGEGKAEGLDMPIISDPETEALASERETLLQAAIQSLPPRQRQALLLWMEGNSYRQIADAVGCSLSAVETLLYRARKNLRARLLQLENFSARNLRRSGLKEWR